MRCNILIFTDKVKCQKDSEFNLFVSNVEELYIRKKCKFIMEKSRGQMKQQEFIFDMVKINEKSSSNIRRTNPY